MSRVQSFVFWSTSQARQLVRAVLMKEPKIGMHHQQLFNEIIKQYPDAKLPTHLVPATLPHRPRPRRRLRPDGARAHRAPRPLDADMLRLNEVEKVIVTRDHEEKRTKTRALFVKHPDPVKPAEMYRWRVVPGSTPTHDVPDPDPEEMFEAKRVEAWRKKVHEKNKVLPPAQRLSTRHPPPPKRTLWLREREWKDKFLDDDPFAPNQGSLLPASAPQNEEQDFYDDSTPYRRSSEQRDVTLDHRRHFSLAAGQASHIVLLFYSISPPTQNTTETKTSDNLSIPPFPRFTQLDIGEKEKQRLQLWHNAVQKKNRRTLHPQNEPASDDGPQITFLERGLHSTVYVRPSKPRAPRQDPVPERDEIDVSPRSNQEDDSHSTEPYERERRPSQTPQAPSSHAQEPEPEPERWERDLPEEIRHSRAMRIYESLVKKSLSGPYAVPRLVNVPPSRPAYLRSHVRREPTRESKDDIEE
ncbi:hypothetical protein IW261DRAFT_1503858 [Armillaria novae-zelandiae]|uniref:Uncharacterized protein n=1 Tax=Armillaria novae-zelandiae TaxID=153914 RepID=A0AA39NWT4_9AGAR|nr:hypothetical protein IW261DRAFT_1503858 [Armillaria novae-zelandiae]